MKSAILIPLVLFSVVKFSCKSKNKELEKGMENNTCVDTSHFGMTINDTIFTEISKQVNIPSIFEECYQYRIWEYENPFIPSKLWIFTSTEDSSMIAEYNIQSTIFDSIAFSKSPTIIGKFTNISYSLLRDSYKQLNKRDSVFFKKIKLLSIDDLLQNETFSNTTKNVFIEGGNTYFLQLKKSKTYQSCYYRAPEYFSKFEKNSKRIWDFISLIKYYLHN